MQVNYEKMDAIERFIQKIPENEIGIQRHRIGNKIKKMPTYEIDINLLRFNEKNGRIFTAKLEKERQLGFRLNSDEPNHEKYFIEMLAEEEEDTKNIRKQMKDVGQGEAGLITADGIIINGNRRCAVKKLLNQKTILVSILPPTVTDEELFDIEYDLQMAEDFKKEYKGIDRLFMIKQAIQYGKTPKQLKQKGITDADIKEAEAVLKKIDLFLEYVEQEGNYSIVSNLLEHFKDFVKELNKIEKAGGDTFEAEEIFYKLMSLNIDEKESQVPHKDIRDTLYFATIDDKVKRALTRNIYEKDANKEDIIRDLSIAKGLAKARKDNENILITVKKLVAQIEGVNIEEAYYDLEDDGYIKIIQHLGTLTQATDKFVREVTDETKRRYSN